MTSIFPELALLVQINFKMTEKLTEVASLKLQHQNKWNLLTTFDNIG